MPSEEAPADRPISQLSRLLLAYSASGSPAVEALADSLVDWAQARGIAVQPLLLPSVEGGDRDLSSLLSVRLTPVADAGQALLCLDARAAILQHPNKWVALLEHDAPDLSGKGFAGRVRLAGIRESRGFFAREDVANSLRSRGWANVVNLGRMEGAEAFDTMTGSMAE